MSRTAWAAISLLLVAIAWGAAFVLMKDAIKLQPIYDFLALRFTLAAGVMVLIRPSVLKKIDRELLLRGVPLGIMLGLGYITQTIGLDLTTAAITGFLTGLYVVFTPLLTWLILRNRVSGRVMVGVGLATLGLALISINGWSIEAGQIWIIICAVLFAGHIVGLGFWSPGRDVYALTVLQLAVAAAVCWIGALSDGYQGPPNETVWVAVIFTAVFATALAFLVQTWAQSIMDASRVALFLTSEVIFAALIAVAVGQETLTGRVILGGAVMVAAMLVVEWPSQKPRQVAEPKLLN